MNLDNLETCTRNICVFIRQRRFVVLTFTPSSPLARHDEQRENHIITIAGNSAVPTETDYRRGSQWIGDKSVLLPFRL